MLEHHRVGAGEPLVLIHGIGGEWQIFEPILDRLAAHHDVIAVNLPGHGGPDDGTPVGMEAYAERLERFFEEIGIERPHVAGNSTGGGVALELARRGSVRTACANSPIGFWTDRERALGSFQLMTALRLGRTGIGQPLMATGAGRTLVFGTGFAKPWRLTAAQARAVLDAQARSARFEETIEYFRSHRFRNGDELRGTPLTVAWGSRDSLLYYVRQAPRARRMLPWAKHVTLQGCGHVPFWDDPDQVAQVLLAATREQAPTQERRSPVAPA